MLKGVDLQSIMRLNHIFNSIDLFHKAISLTPRERNVTNIDDCLIVVELYSYLYSNMSLIDRLFDTVDDEKAFVIEILDKVKRDNKEVKDIINEIV